VGGGSGLGSTSGAGGLGGSTSGLGGSTGGLGGTSGATAGSANRPEFGGGTGTGTGTANRLGGTGGGGLADTLQELQGRADQLMDDAADQLEEVAQRIDDLAEKVPQQGFAARAGGMASGAADTLESVARFMRDNDVNTLQRDLGRIVTQHPITAVLAAVGAGYVVGKVLR
jgi:hypothetical protein